jgi:hypothetical protein
VRATANVKVGKWYYEVLALTDGIMQIGWATERCHFVPEEGLGVGDDNVSDTSVFFFFGILAMLLLCLHPLTFALKEWLWIRLLSKHDLGKFYTWLKTKKKKTFAVIVGSSSIDNNSFVFQ